MSILLQNTEFMTEFSILVLGPHPVIFQSYSSFSAQKITSGKLGEPCRITPRLVLCKANTLSADLLLYSLTEVISELILKPSCHKQHCYLKKCIISYKEPLYV